MEWTRRAILTGLAGVSLPAVTAEAGRQYPSEETRYLDPATEFEVLRLTDPRVSSFLPHYYGRAASRRGNFLLYWSDRTGSPQAFRLDLKTGVIQQLTEARDLDGASLTLMPDERVFCCFDGELLSQTNLQSLKTREIYRVPQGWRRGAGLSVAGDGRHAFFVESQGDANRLRMVPMTRGEPSTVVEAKEPLSHPMPRPKRAGILYRRREGELWLVNYDGAGNRKLKLAAGKLGPWQWSPDGRTVLYLNLPEDPRRLNAIREFTPDANTDALVASTSQFVHFGANGDASVFVGASGSKASPYVLLMLRVARRELSLCEHRASDAVAVAPVFSPDSQHVYFHSDRHGKPAIYCVRVDKLVEKTET